MSENTDNTVCIERRRHERIEIKRPCKVLHNPTLRYMAAKTQDLSPGGAMLELSHHRPLAVGDQIDLLVDWDETGIVNKQTMLAATVVRVGESEGLRQRIGIAFDREQSVTMAA
ncbi:hypothetical protein MNBD_PLANCTO03-1242 [hydrothermal vent metagenome]|uniref:PilZ domain-containing protein n=1 Tax=hydrothermal vent metagenome TaxID=652676 RepID=A0A3B1DJ43_9ZZZZ